MKEMQKTRIRIKKGENYKIDAEIKIQHLYIFKINLFNIFH